MANPRTTETKAKICENVECGKEFNRRLTGGVVDGVEGARPRVKPESVPAFEKRRFCSTKCANKARIIYGEDDFKICQYMLCGKKFTRDDCSTHIAWTKQRFCKHECYSMSRRKDPAISQRDARKLRGPKVSLIKKKKKVVPLRQKFKPKVITTKAEHVFPEGARKEVWKPASWKTG